MNKKDTALLLNISIIILEIIGFILAFSSFGLGVLKYYTQDSNLLLLIACSVFCYYLIKEREDNKFKTPKWAKMLK